MKKVISLILAIVMMVVMCPSVMAISTLSNPIIFTWAWGANKIEVDNSLTVVSWTGGSNSSYRSGFVVYDLPQGFTYTSVKTEVIASFAINEAYLNIGTNQAPTAAIVMVDGDKVKEAYNMKSGTAATALLKEAKAGGVLLGTYKIGQYPRNSRIRNAVINDFFEVHPDVKSIGFYVTNLASDGYSGIVGGIASAITDVEVNFDAYQNYMNATVNMVDEEGNVLQTQDVRNSIGSTVSVPTTIEKDGIIWVRDTNDSVTLKENETVMTVTYHSDAKDREKYVEIIEEMVSELVNEPVSEEIDLPMEYTADDGFVINIEWVSDDEAVVDNSGNVYVGTGVQTAKIYANVWIGEYTSVETKKFTVTVKPIDQGEIDEAVVLSMDFTDEEENRGNFTGEVVSVDCTLNGEFTISAFVRVDDTSCGGTLFNINGAKVEIGDLFTFNEGQWYHVALTNSALYIDGEKECDVTYEPTEGESYIGAYVGKMDNFKVYSKAFSKSVIKNLKKEGYDSPEIEIVSSYVAEGLDSVLVKLSSNGYEGEVKISSYADWDNVRYTASKTEEIADGLNVFSLNIPNMGGRANKDNVTVLVWNEKLQPVVDKMKAGRSYDFGFNYEHPDNHLLSNTFTLMDKDTGRYLISSGISQRVDKGYWTASYMYGENTDGYYRLANTDGEVLVKNCTFVQVEGEKNVYLIKNKDTGKFVTLDGSNVSESDKGSYWVMNVTEYDLVSKAFASEGFFMLSANERERLYGVTGQAMWQSSSRRDKLIEIINGDYFNLDGYAQAEKLRELFTYYPSYQINRAVNKSTTGVEVGYTLSDITKATYSDADGNSKSGYTATAVYDYEEEDLTITIYARSQNVVKNIAKGLVYMPYQFIKPLKTVIDYYATNNQFKAVTGMMYIETNYEVPVENVAITGAHELGHLIDFAAGRMSIGSYKEAYKGTDVVSLSGYGDTALNEDFAEFCQFVISCSGDKEQLRQLSEMFPGRYKALEEGLYEMYGNDEGAVILAIGDSISAGYGLSDPQTEGFVSIVAGEEYEFINMAVSGNKATDVMDQLTNEHNINHVETQAVKDADVITITCGGNDLMALLYKKIAEEYNKNAPRGEVEADEVVKELANGNLHLTLAGLAVLNCEKDSYYMKDGEFDIALNEFIQNLLEITGYIDNINPDAKIIVATQYNPYVEFKDDSICGVVYSGIEEGATRLNEAITANSQVGRYIVADVKTDFDCYIGDEDLYNADPDSMNLDFHPTKAGHKLIAEAFSKMMN